MGVVAEALPVGVLEDGVHDAAVVVMESTCTESTESPIAVQLPSAAAVAGVPVQPLDRYAVIAAAHDPPEIPHVHAVQLRVSSMPVMTTVLFTYGATGHATSPACATHDFAPNALEGGTTHSVPASHAPPSVAPV
jgi:hypothetical protein